MKIALYAIFSLFFINLQAATDGLAWQLPKGWRLTKSSQQLKVFSCGNQVGAPELLMMSYELNSKSVSKNINLWRRSLAKPALKDVLKATAIWRCDLGELRVYKDFNKDKMLAGAFLVHGGRLMTFYLSGEVGSIMELIPQYKSFVESLHFDPAVLKRLKTLKESVRRGDQEAMCKLAEIYLEGRLLAPRSELALDLLKLAGKEKRAQYLLGKMHFHGEGLEQNLKQALEYFQKAALQGSIDAQLSLAEMCFSGQGMEQNPQLAIRYLLQASERGSDEAHYRLAKAMVSVGEFEKAASYLSIAAAGGHLESMVKLGNYCVRGRGVPQDFKRAIELFQGAAEKGSASAWREIGDFYLRANADSTAQINALEAYYHALDLGDTQSLQSIAFMYLKGLGVKQDIKHAKELLHDAADIYGVVTAMEALALMALEANDNKTSVKYFEKAAKKGQARSMYRLALLLQGEKRLKEAHYWLMKASLGGNAEAQGLLKRLSERKQKN